MLPDTAVMTGRCYCGARQIKTSKAPQTVAICHCTDCRRVTGSPAPTFAAFDISDVTVTPALDPAAAVTPGVTRWFCPDCGSPLMATFDYQPGQIYVPTGVLDQAADLLPDVQCHAENALPWLHLPDAARIEGSTRDQLRQV